MDIAQSLQIARAHHENGRLTEAESIYREVLESRPEHGDTLYFLGLCLRQRGDLNGAAKSMQAAFIHGAARGNRLNNLGSIFQALGLVEAAEAQFRKAIELQPELAEAHTNLGALLQGSGRIDAAEVCYRNAIAADPAFFAAHNNFGTLLRSQGKLDVAHEVAQRAVDLDPQSAKALNNLGIILHELNQLMAAFGLFKQAVSIDPDYAEAFNNMGSLFLDENSLDGAVASFKKAIALDPNLADAHNNLGTVRQRQGRYDDALACFERALQLAPNFPPALTNIGTIHHRMNRNNEAISYFQRAMEIDPNYPEVHFNMSEVLLLTRDNLLPGWKEHVWRWRKREFRQLWRDCPAPVWDGGDLTGKTMLLWGEQGIGEEIMYAGMVPDMIEAGVDIVLECEIRLAPLFERSFDGVECVARTVNSAPATGDRCVDCHIATGDLGRWLRPSFDHFPHRPSFLIADANARDAARARYQRPDSGLLVGLSWYSRNPVMGWEKSISLEDWRPLLNISGLTFVDLQYGDTLAQRQALETETGVHIVHDDSIDQLADLDAFAAQVAAMDLVISISNTTVHIAGGLGVPTWVLLSAVPLWRWFQGREDSPWYPSLRLFRQQDLGDWETVLEQVRVALVERVQH